MNNTRILRTVAWAIAINAICILPAFYAGPLSVYLHHDIGLDALWLGIAQSGFWLVASFGAVPMTAIVRRWGTIRSLQFAAAGAAVFSIVIPLVSANQIVFAVLVSLAGIVPALATPVVNVVIMAAVPHGRRAFALIAAGASPVLTLTLAGILASSFGQTPGWRVLYIVAGVVVGVLAVLGRGMPEPGLGGDGVVETEEGPKPSVRPLIIMMIGVGLANSAIGCAISFLVKGGPEAHVDSSLAALLVGVSSAGSIVLRLVIASVVDRTGRDPLPAVLTLLGFGVVGFFALGFGRPTLYSTGIVVVLVLGWSWVGLLMYSILVRYRRDVPAAASIVQMVFFVGGVVGPIAMGLLVQAVSYDVAWWILSGVVLIALVSAAVGFRVLPKFVRPPTARSVRIARAGAAETAEP